MGKQEVHIHCEGTFKFEYDPKSKAFIESLKGFRKIIDNNGTAEDMLKHTAFHINRFGIDSMVEGVGFVKLKGSPAKVEEPFSGITLLKEVDFDFEKLY